MLYATEAFTADEVEVLARHFTNVDRPVFALVNLPEVVKGALFARYSPPGARCVAARDALFDGYAAALPKVVDWARQTFPKEPGDPDFVWRQTIKAKACDAVRGMLPASSLSNVGIYGTGQAYEALLLRMRAHPLPEVRRYAQMMLEELRLVIPAFLKRVDREDRGGAWSAYLAERRERTAEMTAHLLAGAEPEPRPSVTLVDFD